MWRGRIAISHLQGVEGLDFPPYELALPPRQRLARAHESVERNFPHLFCVLGARGRPGFNRQALAVNRLRARYRSAAQEPQRDQAYDHHNADTDPAPARFADRHSIHLHGAVAKLLATPRHL